MDEKGARTVSDTQALQLLEEARRASENAYAPYSDFRTGAAVLTEDGTVHHGALVENLIFGLAMCAERVALFNGVAAGGGRATALALVAPRTAGQRTYPCGPCLQVAVELGGPDMVVIAASTGDQTGYDTRTVGELAPGIPRRGDV